MGLARIKVAALDVCQSLPVFLDKRTFSAAVTYLKRSNRRHRNGKRPPIEETVVRRLYPG
jgi:hypothetical protein